MEKKDFLSVASSLLDQIEKGALLTVLGRERLNTMTIGWASIGFCWHKPVLMVAVRNSRYTFRIIEDADDFTVSVPSEDIKDIIAYCGSKSGSEVDKFQACDLKTKKGQEVKSPIVEIAGTHFECKIIHKAPMDPNYLVKSLERIYPEKDYHTLYFGEILDCYEI